MTLNSFSAPRSDPNVEYACPAAATVTDRQLRGFSCPQEGFDSDLLTIIGSEFSQQITTILLNSFSEEIDRRSSSLFDFLKSWLETQPESQPVWDVSFGTAFRAIRQKDAPRAVLSAAALALRLNACGVPGEWRINFDHGYRLRWDRWLLPRARGLSVTCDSTSARIRTTSNLDTRVSRFHRIEGTWQSDSDELIPGFGADKRRRINFLLPRSLEVEDFGDFDLPRRMTEDVAPEMTLTCQNAIEVIDKYAPIYLPWVLNVVHSVLLLKPDPNPNRTVSGSRLDQPGVVHFSARSSAAHIAEVLVHEATHQYFHLLNWIGPVDDGTDTTMYYSPAVNKERPLRRILVAYHAFANIILFARLCLNNGIIDDGHCAHVEQFFGPYVDQLELPLRDNPALTSIGRALCMPLMDRLR